MPAASSLPAKLEGFVRTEFEDTCRRRFFYGLAFDPYGGTAGLYDLGPTMCAMKSNMLHFWRQHFVIEESMCEVDTTCLTPEEVFKASGHVTRFNDVMVRDTVTGECIRADKFLEEWSEAQLEKDGITAEQKDEFLHLLHDAAGMNPPQIKAVLEKHAIKSPKGNPFSDPFPFNLMFATHIGPEGDRLGYMRPELAQGIILNFKRLMDSGNAQRMPFAGACVGTAFRNEIAPRSALIRVREFTLAEIEHFVNPSNKNHEKFDRVRDVEIWAWPRHFQASNEDPIRMTIGEAVEAKVIDNQTLGYFMGRVALFLTSIGVRFYRFRQHQSTEMAHYAQDCWDAELLTSYGWIECVGIADRSAYDLTQHSNASKKDLCAREEYDEPCMERQLLRQLTKGLIGKTFGKKAGEVMAYLNSAPVEACEAIRAAHAAGHPATVALPSGEEVSITAQMVSFEEKDVKVTGYSYTPSVIEPSFGIGRILYCLLEQSYWVRRDDGGKNDKRAVFSFSPLLAPQKVALLPLMVKPELLATISEIRQELVMRGISVRVDDSSVTIGKKYARVDELGIPFAITCDFEGDGSVTLRERDTASQVRVPKLEVASVVVDLCNPLQPLTWDSVKAKYPAQAAAAEK
ncbi:putative glycyl tRNA synthetase [Leishmania major strain Friedlin]|uniref:glycine--tRNA ligase n=1 Tax=Leishmania major TaxID=5664 RepID=Q4Q131_LEIMA|nr:putative glycyl tRNA synthetase [Leishmania major strain Friedlin]CAG9583928.1 glycyl_tRNA_synthetase_-_putative [Leishmania major strain Friedlin]CAJ09350.1 putative glycyl tRNA synthetase [Leishmania major strain Friedlin]|eukprot:XP_001686967.1 putative glycyl tRNA synthetase [Leishmania major strain Friedlin]